MEGCWSRLITNQKNQNSLTTYCLWKRNFVKCCCMYFMAKRIETNPWITINVQMAAVVLSRISFLQNQKPWHYFSTYVLWLELAESRVEWNRPTAGKWNPTIALSAMTPTFLLVVVPALLKMMFLVRMKYFSALQSFRWLLKEELKNMVTFTLFEECTSRKIK